MLFPSFLLFLFRSPSLRQKDVVRTNPPIVSRAGHRMMALSLSSRVALFSLLPFLVQWWVSLCFLFSLLLLHLLRSGLQFPDRPGGQPSNRPDATAAYYWDQEQARIDKRQTRHRKDRKCTVSLPKKTTPLSPIKHSGQSGPLAVREAKESLFCLLSLSLKMGVWNR